MNWILSGLALFIIWPSVCLASELPKEAVEELSRGVHGRMAGAKLGDGTLISKERAASLKYPLIPHSELEGIVRVGYFSGFAERCGLKWKEKNFEPLMIALRHMHKDWSDIQFAYAAMLHGASMRGALDSKVGQTCSDEFKVNVSNNLIVNK